MKFGINSVHTVFSTEGLKVGSRGYFADSLEEAYKLEHDINDNNAAPALHTLTGINLEQLACFIDESHTSHKFFYFVEAPAEPKEVTHKEWDNRPRLMKVWKNNYYEAETCKVLAVRYSEVWLHPVVALDYTDTICTFKHCAELEEYKTPVKEPEAEKHYRPYSNADEFIEDYKRRFCPDCKGVPAIWVKNAMDTLEQVVGIAENSVKVNNEVVSYFSFLDTYTYPDETPCGMEE